MIGIDGSPIAGLFSAGELGSIWTELYPGGGNLMECIVSGIAADRLERNSATDEVNEREGP